MNEIISKEDEICRVIKHKVLTDGKGDSKRLPRQSMKCKEIDELKANKS